MNAALIHGSQFISRSSNFQNKFVVHLQCHLVHRALYHGEIIKIEFDELNSFEKLLENQKAHLVLSDLNSKFHQPITIYFRDYFCQYHKCKNNNIRQYFFYPFCMKCFNCISKNLLSLNSDDMSVRTNEEIIENYEILQYPIDNFLTEENLLDYYMKKNITHHIISDFSIQLNEEDLYFEYIDRLCFLHFIEKTNDKNNVNCYFSATKSKKNGNFILHLFAKRKISLGEKLIVLRGKQKNREELNDNNKFGIKYFLYAG
jgi:hypothetical protein